MKALFIIAQEGYQDIEYKTPKKILEENGIEVITASKKTGTCKGALGGSTEATISINDVDVYDYDAIVFIGGPGARDYQHDVKAHLTAQEAINRDKILAAICIAPIILAYADVLEGKKATIWNNDGKQQEILEKNGATYTGEDVTTDGKIITANGPRAAEKFGNKIVELLK
ncbi:MAG: DJ-1/PfpI family protein [Nanoarchaeota archaeon]|nr:DJ-1/PfpI family protein [Nanoarchaeota archaeon]MBU1631611.1 DJ-1/PfpI family protein [Nanoarchaeota archaeon]MBU1876636.1 DJ-1/PfpI family protein [Nanoarchaeota archaeon]